MLVRVSNMLRKKLKLDVSLPNNEILKVPTTSHTVDMHSKSGTIVDTFLKLEIELNNSLKKLNFQNPVAYVYRPLDYAFEPHSVFVSKYLDGPKQLLFVGMNPGPWGMCQTGIPFGEVNTVKEWFQINEIVSKPENECPERKIDGISCTKTEISGQRIWGLMKNICGTPENFFKNAYMYNYCPIAMMKSNGTNITPSEIKGITSKQLEELCDKTLFEIIKILQAKIVVCVGKYAEKRLQVVKKENSLDVEVLYLLHPSPRVPKNQNWLITAEKRLKDLDLMTYLQPK